MGIINRVLGTARRSTSTPATSTGRTRRPRRGGTTPGTGTGTGTGRGGGLLSGLLRRKGL